MPPRHAIRSCWGKQPNLRFYVPLASTKSAEVRDRREPTPNLRFLGVVTPRDPLMLNLRFLGVVTPRDPLMLNLRFLGVAMTRDPLRLQTDARPRRPAPGNENTVSANRLALLASYGRSVWSRVLDGPARMGRRRVHHGLRSGAVTRLSIR